MLLIPGICLNINFLKHHVWNTASSPCFGIIIQKYPPILITITKHLPSLTLYITHPVLRPNVLDLYEKACSNCGWLLTHDRMWYSTTTRKWEKKLQPWRNKWFFSIFYFLPTPIQTTFYAWSISVKVRETSFVVANYAYKLNVMHTFRISDKSYKINQIEYIFREIRKIKVKSEKLVDFV